jgi:hypothetical protein
VYDCTSQSAVLPHVVASAWFTDLFDRLPGYAPSAKSAVAMSTNANLALLPADDAAHDRYFCIERSTEQPTLVFFGSVLNAAALFHDEMKTSYGRAESGRFTALGAGLSALLGHLAGMGPPPVVRADLPVSDAVGSVDPERRWILGHQLFAALTQGLVLAMRAFESAMQDCDDAAAATSLSLAGDLLLASASAFRFTADFSPEIYRDVIRPSMAPPQMRRGFSGLLSSDHKYLVAVMTRSRPSMAQARQRFAELHDRLTQALQLVYDVHKLVCARFDGDAVSSIRTEACSDLPGVVLLDRFKHSRLRLLQPAGDDDLRLS